MSTEVYSHCLTCNVYALDDCVYETLGTDILRDLISEGKAVQAIQSSGGRHSKLLRVAACYSGIFDFQFYADHAGHRIDVVNEYGKVVASFENCGPVSDPVSKSDDIS